jgi:hypothetical protein
MTIVLDLILLSFIIVAVRFLFRLRWAWAGRAVKGSL